jgi:hypothetical protein
MVLAEIAEKSQHGFLVKPGILTTEVKHMNKLFCLGATVYPLLEIVWRGRTHYSMSLAGGTSLLLIGHIRKLPLSFPTRTLLCGLGITGIEYLCGHFWNSEYQVWDYRRMPLNYHGQACLPYTLAWCGLGAISMKLLDMLEHQNEPVS